MCVCVQRRNNLPKVNGSKHHQSFICLGFSVWIGLCRDGPSPPHKALAGAFTRWHSSGGLAEVGHPEWLPARSECRSWVAGVLDTGWASLSPGGETDYLNLGSGLQENEGLLTARNFCYIL